MDVFLNGFFAPDDALSFLNFGVFLDFTALTSFLVSVDSLKLLCNRVCCFFTASLCRAWLIAFFKVQDRVGVSPIISSLEDRPQFDLESFDP